MGGQRCQGRTSSPQDTRTEVQDLLSWARGHGRWPELCWGQHQGPLPGVRPVTEQLRLGSGHTSGGLVAALDAQRPGGEVGTPGGRGGWCLGSLGGDSVSPPVKPHFLDVELSPALKENPKKQPWEGLLPPSSSLLPETQGTATLGKEVAKLFPKPQNPHCIASIFTLISTIVVAFDSSTSVRG